MGLHDGLGSITPELAIEALETIDERLNREDDEGELPEARDFARMITTEFAGLVYLTQLIGETTDVAEAQGETIQESRARGALILACTLVEIAQQEKLKGIVGDHTPPTVE